MKGRPDPVSSGRRIGVYEGDYPGPLFVVFGGVHGNEPAGVTALKRVFSALEKNRPAFRGRFVGLVGNKAALAKGLRFIDTDLNRAWTAARVAALKAGGADAPKDSEASEQMELIAELRPLLRAVDGPAFFLDLHTTSADGPPFTFVGDTLPNRSWAARLPITKVLGMEEELEGTLLGLLNELGHTALGVEGGRHDDPESPARHESIIWVALEAAGMIKTRHIPGRSAHRRRLNREARGVPHAVEVLYRRSTRAGDGFKMEPGWRHFQPVRSGQPLARDAEGTVLSPENGLVFMPLYQGQGSDGFFIGRPVGKTRLAVSSMLRRLGADRLAHMLPGIRRWPREERTFLVDPNAPAWVVRAALPLLGLRNQQVKGEFLLVGATGKGAKSKDRRPPRQK